MYGCPKGGRGCKTKSVGFFFFTWVNNNSELGIGRKVLGFSFSRFVETKAKCLRIKIMNDATKSCIKYYYVKNEAHDLSTLIVLGGGWGGGQ